MLRPDNPQKFLKDQYADSSNLNARSRLHAQFSTNKYPWLRWVFDHFDLPDRCRILELGCGPAGLWKANRDRIPDGWDITLSDSSPGMISEAKAQSDDIGRPFSFTEIDAQAIPFEDESFDAVIANHMLYHVPDLDKALAEIRRVLKPGGRFYATTNGTDHMRELRELVGRIVADLPFVRGDNTKAFSTDNGAARLGKFFSDVTLHCREDALEVTEAQPLVAYVLSVRGPRTAFTDEKAAELSELIKQRINSRGVFRITKTPGIFTARRAKSR